MLIRGLIIFNPTYQNIDKRFYCLRIDIAVSRLIKFFYSTMKPETIVPTIGLQTEYIKYFKLKTMKLCKTVFGFFLFFFWGVGGGGGGG